MSIKRQHCDIEISPGLTLQGDLYLASGGEKLAILCHGFTAYRRYLFFPYLAERLAAEGVHVLVVDFSRNGMNGETGEFIDPDGFSRNTFGNEEKELIELVLAVSEKGIPSLSFASPNEIFLMGHSRGGATVLGAAADPRLTNRIDRISAWSTPSDVAPERFGAGADVQKIWRENGAISFLIERLGIEASLSIEVLEDMENDPYRIERFCKAIDIPVLVVHGDKDERISLDCGEMILAWTQNGSLAVIKDANHVFSVERPVMKPSPQIEEATHALIRFFHE